METCAVLNIISGTWLQQAGDVLEAPAEEVAQRLAYVCVLYRQLHLQLALGNQQAPGVGRSSANGS